MKKTAYSNGNIIGLFDGNTIKDNNGKVIYWLSDDDVFAPTSYIDDNLQSFNKGQSTLIGKYADGQCLASGEVIFKIHE